jgi:hypothetical protein
MIIIHTKKGREANELSTQVARSHYSCWGQGWKGRWNLSGGGRASTPTISKLGWKNHHDLMYARKWHLQSMCSLVCVIVHIQSPFLSRKYFYQSSATSSHGPWGVSYYHTSISNSYRIKEVDNRHIFICTWKNCLLFLPLFWYSCLCEYCSYIMYFRWLPQCLFKPAICLLVFLPGSTDDWLFVWGANRWLTVRLRS